MGVGREGGSKVKQARHTHWGMTNPVCTQTHLSKATKCPSEEEKQASAGFLALKIFHFSFESLPDISPLAENKSNSNLIYYELSFSCINFTKNLLC